MNSTKRLKLDYGNKSEALNELDKSSNRVLEHFLNWMDEKDFKISNKIKITTENSCARFGLIAEEYIETDEVIFSVPRSALLWEGNCKISKELMAANITTKGSGWAKLLLCLMLEYTSYDSNWKPYMDLIPPIACMDQPMFWDEEQLDWLKGTGTCKAVVDDVVSMESEYYQIALPFIKENEHIGFDTKIHSLKLWKYMVAFVMAYSFTEPMESENDNPTPKMVPLADILNHIALNNAHLEFEKDHLQMVAIKPINKGEEIYNTYGQLPNNKLLQMFGFVEKYPCNIYDTVDISISVIYQIVTSEDHCNQFPCFKKKKKYFSETMDIEPEDTLILSKNGILSAELFKGLFKILPLTEKEFEEVLNNEGYASETSEDSNLSESDELDIIELEYLTKLPIKVKKMLIDAVIQVEENYINFNDVEALSSELITSRYTRVKQLVNGQLKLLNNLKNKIQ